MNLTKEEKKKHFPVLLFNRRGNITKTCFDLNMTRRTWQNWVNEDEDFAESCHQVAESLIDLGQEMLIKNVEAGKSKDIQFLLKTLGRHRGFGEKVEVEHTGIVRHAHGVKHYPPEPKSMAEWERQVEEAQRLRNTENAQLSEGQNRLPELEISTREQKERVAGVQGENFDPEANLESEPLLITTV